MKRWNRFFHQPVIPLGENRQQLTGSKEHIALSRYAAAQGMVLLKNEEGMLPIRRGTKIALFGKASVDYVKGGGGSGDVTVAYVRNLVDGMLEKEQDGKVCVFPELNAFYQKAVALQMEQGVLCGQTQEPELAPDLLSRASAFAEMAVISICRFSGEGWDRSNQDFYLTDAEKHMIQQVESCFDRIVVVLNVGGMVDTSWFRTNPKIQAVLLAWQGGMEGAMAQADILCGDVNPSGKLVDTFASCFDDYPSSQHFHDSEAYVEYFEDIYVGYRYFETIPGAKGKVNYSFGYGLSYSVFSVKPLAAEANANCVTFEIEVTNQGPAAGKETVMIYASAPQGKLGKPAKELKAFAKTRLLQPGEVQKLYLCVEFNSLASYDDLGKLQKSAWVLEKGTYHFYYGNDVSKVRPLEYIWNLEEDQIVCQLKTRCQPIDLQKRMLSDGSFEMLPPYTGKRPEFYCDDDLMEAFIPEQKYVKSTMIEWSAGYKGKERLQLEQVANGEAALDAFAEEMTDQELCDLLGGQRNTGVANTWGIGNNPLAGVPNVMTADGPAGLRIKPDLGVCTTAWPCATLLACSFDPELARQIGNAGSMEVKENNIGVWLTPAMNIHRTPLCGRNFEYYSEDPLVAGEIGAAMIEGIQANHIAASMKHFACNNKETNRKNSDSRVSERALREIYLKGFEIAVKKSQPWTVMSSYNLLNGYRASENYDLLTGILREEWGFTGMVTTDWWNYALHEKEVLAGNDLKMAIGDSKRLMEQLEQGTLTRNDLLLCAKRILAMILKLD